MEKELITHEEHAKNKDLDQDSSLIDSFSEPEAIEMPLVKSPEEVKFVKKLNWTVLPIIFLIVFIQVSSFFFQRHVSHQIFDSLLLIVL